MYGRSGTGVRFLIVAKQTFGVQCSLTSWQHFSYSTDLSLRIKENSDMQSQNLVVI